MTFILSNTAKYRLPGLLAILNGMQPQNPRLAMLVTELKKPGASRTLIIEGPRGERAALATSIAAQMGMGLQTLASAKYIGETEKNLERLAATAKQSNQILFFDEADALFGKRTEVKDSHDRYANLQTAYGLLLIGVEKTNQLPPPFLQRARTIAVKHY